MQGPQGEEGLDGDQGPMGPIGPPGTRGRDGRTGKSGHAGLAGIPGQDVYGTAVCFLRVLESFLRFGDRSPTIGLTLRACVVSSSCSVVFQLYVLTIVLHRFPINPRLHARTKARTHKILHTKKSDWHHFSTGPSWNSRSHRNAGCIRISGLSWRSGGSRRIWSFWCSGASWT